MKKILAAAALGAITLSAPAHAQSAPAVPSVIGGGLSAGAVVAIGLVVFLAVVVSDDDDTTATTTTPSN